LIFPIRRFRQFAKPFYAIPLFGFWKTYLEGLEEMKCKTVGFLIAWFSFLALGMVVFTFLHECGHGFGAQLDGTHISTGFDRVGDFGKRPSDPDFRSNDTVTGELNSSGLLGPFTNWLFAILFTVLLLQRPKADRTTFLLGAGAVVNAWSRLWQMTAFFVAALLGRVHLEDEVGWGLRAIPGLHFPIPFNDFFQLTQTQPALFFSEPRVYFWPLVSLVIVLTCFVFAYRCLYRLFGSYMPTKAARWLFGLMPLVVTPPVFMLLSWLDNLVRINW
jgi:hypothetical protein